MFCRLVRPPVRAPADTPALEMDHRLSARPETPEERQGPPGLLGRPLRTCRGATHPAGYDPPSPLLLFEKIYGEDHCCLQDFLTLGHPEQLVFEAVPTAHTLACLRQRPPRCRDRRQARYRPGGLTRGRAGFAPAGRLTKFHGVIASSNPNRPTGPGRTGDSACVSDPRWSRNGVSNPSGSPAGRDQGSPAGGMRFRIARFLEPARPAETIGCRGEANRFRLRLLLTPSRPTPSGNPRTAPPESGHRGASVVK